MRISSAAKKAFLLGGLCSVAYLAVYVAKNTLSACTPQITEAGVFSTEQIGSMASVYFIVYAIGQLINGAIGDKVKAKYMISFGLVLSSIGILTLPRLSAHPLYAYIAYGSTGFCLAMIYGPMTKVVAENVEPLYATRCSIGYNLASFLGSPVAGLLAAAMPWLAVFHTTGAVVIGMGTVTFLVFTLMERKGIVKYGQYQKPKSTAGGVKLLLKRQIVKFIFIAALTGVVRTTVVFWLPTYISQHLGFAPDTAAMIFTVASLFISFSAILSIAVYERLNNNMDLTILLSFGLASVSFLIVFFLKNPFANVAFMVIGILANNCASSMLWSRYCPSLYDTGMVSSATGFLDFCSYMAASVSTKLFADAVGSIGWSGLILIWLALMCGGVVVALPWNRWIKKRSVVS